MLRIPQQPIRRFARDIFEAAGSSADEAGIVADHLVEASLMGHDFHGVIRICKYVDWVQRAKCCRTSTSRSSMVAAPCWSSTVASASAKSSERRRWIPPPTARSRRHGDCRSPNSGHLGRIGAWPELLAGRGLASIHFVNTSGFGILVAHGGSDRRLSANPIAAGVALAGRAPIILDIATSVIAERLDFTEPATRPRPSPSAARLYADFVEGSSGMVGAARPSGWWSTCGHHLGPARPCSCPRPRVKLRSATGAIRPGEGVTPSMSGRSPSS